MSAAVTSRPRRSWPQRFLIAFNVLCIVLALLLAGGLSWANLKTGSLQRVSLGRSLATEPAGSDTPQNYLLVGTDSAAGLAPNDPAVQGRADVGGARSDTMMILRIIPKEKRALLLALPRDLYVPIYDEAGAQHGAQKLNSAIEYGGPKALVETINRNFQVPIHHYLQVDWEGFKKVVKAIDGVPIYFSDPVRDVEHTSEGDINHTGLDVEAPGCVTLGPDQALGYVRARYFEYKQGGRWRADPTADLGRASRQQQFIQQALKRAISKGIRNPITLNDLLNAALKSVYIDEGLTPGAILSLGQRFQSFDPENLQKLALPVTDGYVHGESVQRLVPDEAAAMFAVFRGEDASTVGPRSVTVQVMNGSGAYNQATKVSAALAGEGFTAVSPGDASSPGQATVLRYSPGNEAKARLVARYLDADVRFVPATAGESEADVMVVTGTGFRSVLATAKPEAQVPGPSTTTTTTTTTTTAPTSSGEGPSSSTTRPAVGAGPTTTLPGYVPTIPPGTQCG